LSDTSTSTLQNTVTPDDHSIGPTAAPITLVEYGNFECIDCGRAYPILKQVQHLIDNNLRFVFRHFPIVRTHPHSVRAAEASEAAAAQGKFWEMHDELFTHQAALEDTDLVNHASRIGLAVPKFHQELKEHTYLEKVESEYKRGLFDEHITGTPTIYINGDLYTGAFDTDSLLLAIKKHDTDGRIQLPARLGGLRGFLNRLHK